MSTKPIDCRKCKAYISTHFDFRCYFRCRLKQIFKRKPTAFHDIVLRVAPENKNHEDCYYSLTDEQFEKSKERYEYLRRLVDIGNRPR